MKKMFKLGIIGAGTMAKSIVTGAVIAGIVKEKKIIISSKSEDDFDKFEEFKITTTLSNRAVAENSEYLLLAVKPQNFAEVVEDLKGVIPEKVISIMAGISKYRIRREFSSKTKVCRCMPNIPCSIADGMTAGDIFEFEIEDQTFVTNLFSSIGDFMSIKEEKLDAVTGISGSGPAYVYLFIQSMIEAGIKNGLDESEARRLVYHTVLGANNMVEEYSETPISELIDSVCSKGGTTIEAIKSFEKDDFKGAVERAVDACVAKAKELYR